MENDSNYLSSIPEEYVTDTELNAKGYLTEHQDISGKVDKVEGKSLISDTEIARLASVDNYDDTALSNRIKSIEDEVPNLATKTYVGEQIANAEHLKREIVTVLPSDAEASDNIIYMLKVESATGNDKYKEYMKIDGTVQMVGDTSVDLTDYAKTADIPTSLPADGGNSATVNNHTVETNVPADAVFTDTIYDDTEAKESIEELSSNLDTLEYSEIAGGKNLANINDFKLLTTNPSRYGYEWINMKGGTYTFNITNGNNILYIGYKHNGEFVNPSSVMNNSKVQTITISDGDDIVIWYENGVTENTVTKLQLEVGGIATEYEPYIPSIKMLAEEVNQQNESLGALGKRKNLLNPTLQTTTINGITCTANEDGTYTLKGKSTSNSNTNFVMSFSSQFKGKCKLIGCPSGVDSIAELQCNYNEIWESKNTDHGKGSILDSTNLLTAIAIVIFPNVSVNNLIFKPMITTDLSATYDDFVPYTGEGDTLTADVAKIKNNLGSTDISSIGDGTVTGAINELNRNLSHVGMIIHTTTLDTEDKVKAIYGGTSWTKIEGRFLLGQSSNYAINSTGGEATHKLTVNEMPSHNHAGKISAKGAYLVFYNDGTPGNRGTASYSNSTGDTFSLTSNGGDQAHNNMPPYKTVYIWERTA